MRTIETFTEISTKNFREGQCWEVRSFSENNNIFFEQFHWSSGFLRADRPGCPLFSKTCWLEVLRKISWPERNFLTWKLQFALSVSFQAAGSNWSSAINLVKWQLIPSCHALIHISTSLAMKKLTFHSSLGKELNDGLPFRSASTGNMCTVR